MLSKIRKADHFKNTDTDVVSDAIQMEVTVGTIIQALSVLSITVNNRIIGEQEYLQKYVDFLSIERLSGEESNANDIDNDDDDDDDDDDDNDDDDNDNKSCIGEDKNGCALCCLFIFLPAFHIFIIFVLTLGNVR